MRPSGLEGWSAPSTLKVPGETSASTSMVLWVPKSTEQSEGLLREHLVSKLA